MWNCFSKTFSLIPGMVVLAGLMLSGCATPVGEVGPPSRATPEEPEQAAKPDPRALTSMRLTDQARLRLEAGRPDEAIRILERAVNLDPGNGRNFYFLAEAWLIKGALGQAREYNRLAGIYLDDEGDSWKHRIKKQKEKIEEAP